jgi:hypothetical protein
MSIRTSKQEIDFVRKFDAFERRIDKLERELNRNLQNPNRLTPSATLGPASPSGGASAGNAIHTNIDNEIANITEKAAIVDADLILIEDSEAANAKKRVQVTNIVDSLAAEIEVIKPKYTSAEAIAAVEGEATLDLTGDVNLVDGKTLSLGTDDDLSLSHSGVAGTITNTTGNLSLDQTSGDIILISRGGVASDVIVNTQASFKIQDRDDGSEKLLDFDTNARTLTIGATDGNDDIALSHYGNATISGNLILHQHTSPIYRFKETDGALDNKYWDWIVSGEQLRGRLVNDALGAVQNWLTVDRTGMTVDDITFPEGSVKNQVDNAGYYTGVGDDLGLYHTGSNSVIANTTGHLQLYGATGNSDIVLNVHRSVKIQDGDDGNVDLFIFNTTTRILTLFAGADLGTTNHAGTLNILSGNLIMDGAGADDERLQVPYLTGVPASVANGSVWMEADGLHIYYGGAEKVVAGV